MARLDELMNKNNGGAAPPAPAGLVPAPGVPEREPMLCESSPFARIEIEAVVCGVLMKVAFAGVTPSEAVGLLRQADSNAKFRDDFPSKAAFGKRESKSARAMVLAVEAKDSGKFIKITATDGENDLSIQVGKKLAEEWLPKLEALHKLSDKNLEKIRAAFENKKEAAVILTDAEQFGLRYWVTDEGKAFLEEMVAEPPPLAPEGGAE